ncbi:MAG TPA: type II secretion system F family protein [Candidatus Dormibacteraeota bacterium]|nr:type II secretion system F family protein [Candidatus Dormibacteraeota bacterium]
MQVYKYRALAGDGSYVEGVMQAAHPEDVRAALLARDLRVSTVSASGAKWYDWFKLQPKVKSRDIVLFCRQLASFVAVGVPVTTAMRTFAEEAHSKLLRETYVNVVTELERGMRLSDAFASHPLVFPTIVIDMVRSAEETGALDKVLRQAARHLEREAAARQRIRAAMTYPAIIASLAIVIAVGMVVFVLPRFKDLYASLNVNTPGILNGLLNLSAFITAHYLWIGLGVVAAILAAWYALRQDAGRLFIDRLVLHLPLFSPLIKTMTTERFCRTLGDMLAAGVPMSQTYGVVLSNVHNRVYRRSLAAVGTSIAAGEGLSHPLATTKVFSPAVTQLVRVGEETGTLDTNLIQAADMNEEELDYRIKRLTGMLEPMLIVFVGLLVGFVAVTMVTSIYSLANGVH